MKCETEKCNNEVPEINIGRVCAYQYEEENDVAMHGHNGCVTCNCCDECRQLCHEALFNED